MESWLQFLVGAGGLLLFGLLVILRGEADERRWRREREAEEDAKRAAE